MYLVQIRIKTKNILLSFQPSVQTRYFITNIFNYFNLYTAYTAPFQKNNIVLCIYLFNNFDLYKHTNDLNVKM